MVPDKALTAPLGVIESILRETDRQTRAKDRYPVDAVLSHAGRVELEDLCAPGFTPRTAFVMERPLPGEAPVLNVLELDWHTEITVSWWACDFTQERLGTLLDPFGRVPAPVASAAARDELSTAVAEVWSGILGIAPERLDDDTDFEQLGGNSLALLTMLAAVADRVAGEPARAGFDAALPDLVRAPTLRKVTAAVRAARTA